ncbi:hypothetical protein [Clostridium perfringens]
MLENILINALITLIFTPFFWKLISKVTLYLSILSEKIALTLSK